MIRWLSLVLLMCSVALGQGITAAPNTTVSPKTTIASGMAGGGTVALVVPGGSGRTGCASGGASCVITTTGAGHGLFLELMVVSATAVISGVTDSGGTDIYTQVVGATVRCQSQEMEIWYTPSTSGAITGIVATDSTGSAYNVWAYETTGTNATTPLDQSTTLSCASGCSTNITGAAITTTAASELIIAQATVSGSVTAIFGGNAFTNDSIQNANGWAHLVTSSSGLQPAPQWTSSGTNANCSNIASFKP